MTDSTRRTVRTAFQTLLAVASALPLLAGDPRLADLPAFAVLVAVATAVSRLMATAAVEQALPRWLRKEEDADQDEGRDEEEAQ
ncbi:hypothetical protein GCM10018980_30280 [Streptomyces capoamus]|uniref:Holin n=1 Tax=Streptomyces capoamus TaxID=68183 RepID=A0A919C4F3_9ACTN|nr:hypothetical protein [Streptomyces capoamus]GGW17975.1 hypothetical protein GCM10010501_41310 [Streptomyces libani subsp. rufus]GHG49457.1 hypothetical protein GCM10018980_30280 [Streptomyces capoamus]